VLVMVAWHVPFPLSLVSFVVVPGAVYISHGFFFSFRQIHCADIEKSIFVLFVNSKFLETPHGAEKDRSKVHHDRSNVNHGQ